MVRYEGPSNIFESEVEVTDAVVQLSLYVLVLCSPVPAANRDGQSAVATGIMRSWILEAVDGAAQNGWISLSHLIQPSFSIVCRDRDDRQQSDERE